MLSLVVPIIGQVVLKKIFNKCGECIFVILPLSPLEKGRGLLFEQTCHNPRSLVENGPVVLVKKMKMWKVYKLTDVQSNRCTDRCADSITDVSSVWNHTQGAREINTNLNFCPFVCRILGLKHGNKVIIVHL